MITQLVIDIKDQPLQWIVISADIFHAMSNRLPDTTFKYWYSLDEPQTLDNYYPYNFVNNILKTSLGSKPIITTFYPTWGGYPKRGYCNCKIRSGSRG
jgi:hypothetical protein